MRCLAHPPLVSALALEMPLAECACCVARHVHDDDVIALRALGLQATLTSAPAGHVHSTLVVAGSSVKDAMARWGDMMLLAAAGGKERSMKWTLDGDVGA